MTALQQYFTLASQLITMYQQLQSSGEIAQIESDIPAIKNAYAEAVNIFQGLKPAHLVQIFSGTTTVTKSVQTTAPATSK